MYQIHLRIKLREKPTAAEETGSCLGTERGGSGEGFPSEVGGLLGVTARLGGSRVLEDDAAQWCSRGRGSPVSTGWGGGGWRGGDTRHLAQPPDLASEKLRCL